jgi:hypothetical protein
VWVSVIRISFGAVVAMLAREADQLPRADDHRTLLRAGSDGDPTAAAQLE